MRLTLSRRFFPFFVCLAIALMAAGAAARAQELAPAERTTLLQQLRDIHARNPAFEATFTEERTSHLLTKPVFSEGSVAFSVPDKFRRDVKSPSPSMTISNGHTMWIYYPAFNEVEIYTLGQRSFFDESLAALTAGLNFEHIDEYYNFRAYHDAAGYRLDLTPKKPTLRRVVEELTLYLSNDFLPTRTEITLPKGDHLSTTYHNARRHPIPASEFEFTPPPGAQITHPLGK
ncbi:MAG TPA: outer membrane lipoprotein carrier protein LolA [Chthoniobacteraceae bacterium]|jgi:outer membrane lipoprotein-sorting protein|nr:outer membrane lipoprotein carrier protein LolA [Chthoniobacteraceae bacterium]